MMTPAIQLDFSQRSQAASLRDAFQPLEIFFSFVEVLSKSANNATHFRTRTNGCHAVDRMLRILGMPISRLESSQISNGGDWCSWAEVILRYSYRKISTGRIREAARAGISVAATLMASAAAAIQTASSALA